MTPCAVCASRPQTATQTSRTTTTTNTATIAAATTTATIDPNVCCSAPVTWVLCAPSSAESYSQLRECCERLGHASIVRSGSLHHGDSSSGSSNQDTKYNNRRKAGAVATPAQSCCWREVDVVKLGVSESAPELSTSSVISSSVRIVELTTDNQRINKFKMDTPASCCSRSSIPIPTSSTSATTTIVVPRSHLTHDSHCHHCHHRENHTSTPSLSLLQSSAMSPSSPSPSPSSSTTCPSCASSSVSYDHHLHHNHREQQQASSRNSSVRQQSCRSRTSRTVPQWSLIPCIVLLALATAADACSTRSTPKARSSYISQLHQQQPPQQYPRPAQHYPPLLPRHPSPMQDTPTPSRTVPARAPYSQQQQSAQPQQDQQQVPQQQQQQPQKSQLIPSVPTVSDADLTTQRPNVTFRTYPCPEAYAKWYCLNGAHCFSVKIGESVLYNCECADGYMGQRCEFKDLDGTYIQRRGILIQTASIAFSVLVVVFLVVIIILYTVHSRQQQQLHKENGQYVYRDWSAVVTAKQVPVTVLTPDILERTV